MASTDTTVYEMKLTLEQLALLESAIKAGKFADLGVTTIEVVEPENAGSSTTSDQKAKESPTKASSIPTIIDESAKAAAIIGTTATVAAVIAGAPLIGIIGAGLAAATAAKWLFGTDSKDTAIYGEEKKPDINESQKSSTRNTESNQKS